MLSWTFADTESKLSNSLMSKNLVVYKDIVMDKLGHKAPCV